MREKLPGWEVYPVLGNHESFPVDQFPNPPSNSWLMNGVRISHFYSIFILPLYVFVIN